MKTLELDKLGLEDISVEQMKNTDGGRRLLFEILGFLFEQPAIINENVGSYGQHLLFK